MVVIHCVGPANRHVMAGWNGGVASLCVGGCFDGLGGHLVHEEDLPDMAVEVSKAMSIHEPVVLWLAVGAAAGGHSLGDQLIDLAPVLGRQCDQHFGGLRGV